MYGPHTLSGNLDSGKIYIVEILNPSARCAISYSGKAYGPTMYYGSKFVAGADSTYTVIGGCLSGIEITVREDQSMIDSVGSRPQAYDYLEALTYQFELDLPESGVCADSFEMVAIGVPVPVGPNMLNNADFNTVSCPIPAGFKVSCVQHWEESHGDPLALNGTSPEFAPYSGRMCSQSDSTALSKPIIRGDGIK